MKSPTLLAVVAVSACLLAAASERPRRPAAHRASSAALPVALPAAYTVWRPDSNADAVAVAKGTSLLHKHKKRKCKKGKVCKESDDDDDFDLPASFWKPREPKGYGNFKMDESAKIYYALLGQIASPNRVAFAAAAAKEHRLGEAAQNLTVSQLRDGLAHLQQGATDFLLDAAQASNPDIPAKEQRARFAQMLETMLEHATKVTQARKPLGHRHMNMRAPKAASLDDDKDDKARKHAHAVNSVHALHSLLKARKEDSQAEAEKVAAEKERVHTMRARTQVDAQKDADKRRTAQASAAKEAGLHYQRGAQ